MPARRLLVTAIVVAALLLGTACGSAPAARATPAAHPVSPAPTYYATPRPHAQGPAPSELQIPAISLTASVESLGLTSTLALATPQNVNDVGWYDLGASPGQPGDAVIAGHLDGPTGAPAVFWNLGLVQPGNQIDVTYPSSTAAFTVTTVASVPYGALGYGSFTTTGPAQLTLITCAGTWDSQKQIYDQRLLVTATLNAS